MSCILMLLQSEKFVNPITKVTLLKNLTGKITC